MIPITAGWIASFYSGSCWRNDPANFPVIARLPPHAWHLFLWEGSGGAVGRLRLRRTRPSSRVKRTGTERIAALARVVAGEATGLLSC
ncbi:protein of unknown function [Cupriavidus taiwanensis]|nr:protein of unknown function [Cupriavidus taiwanensis]